MKINYSAQTNGFYPDNMKGRYVAAGTWPDDAVEITDVERETYWRATPPEGYQLDGDSNGRPAWSEVVISLENAKLNRATAIRAAYAIDAAAPVPHLGRNWNGGFDSAIKLDAAKRLAEMAGAAEVTFFDTANTPHILTMVDATSVTMAVAGAYQAILTKKQGKLVTIDAAATVAEVNAVVW